MIKRKNLSALAGILIGANFLGCNAPNRDNPAVDVLGERWKRLSPEQKKSFTDYLSQAGSWELEVLTRVYGSPNSFYESLGEPEKQAFQNLNFNEVIGSGRYDQFPWLFVGIPDLEDRLFVSTNEFIRSLSALHAR